MTAAPLVAVVLGTRPEAVKLAPVVLALRRETRVRVALWATGQHREMAGTILDWFGVTPDVDLGLMRPDQTLAGLTAGALSGLDPVLDRDRPALVLVQGDTTTAFAAALASFYRRVPVGHVEAGLRTGDMQSPWPEEANRRLITRLTDLHFAATPAAAANLAADGVPGGAVHVVGNPVVDALRLTVARIDAAPPGIPDLPPEALAGGRQLVLVTGHRRESFGAGFASICGAVADLAGRFPDVSFVYPVHRNPHVRSAVDAVLRPAALSNVHLLDPLDYPPFVALFRRATLVLSDSGGVQEEAPALGKPVLVMRDTTERPEAVAAGTVRLVGPDRGRIVAEATRLLTDPAALAAMSVPRPVFGDGFAADRIAALSAAFVTGSTQTDSNVKSS